MKQISILGCGWLGLPLAKTLLENGHSINGSTTSQEKISVLKNAGINPFQIILSGNKTEGKIGYFLENSKILIINIPPKLRVNNSEDFVEKINYLIPYIEKSTVKNVLFISSTSVYRDDESIITEDTIPNPKTESGKQLLEVEQILQNNLNFKTTILRFAGLIGEDRNPIYFLAGKTNLDNPNFSVNLIHRIDCIGIIQKIITQNHWEETFNAVAPFHPSRKDYYTRKAIDLHLELPEFNYKNLTTGKTISSIKSENVLNYSYLKPCL